MNSKMKKRLSWINPTDQKQAEWLAKYIAKKQGNTKSINGSYLLPQQSVEEFLLIATSWPEDSSSRERCRNLKAAWNSWKKRKQTKNKVVEGTYTISITARKELERLAKREKCSLSHVVETTLLNAKNIERQTKELQRIIENARPGTRIDTNYICMLFNKDVFLKKLDSTTLQHEIYELKQRLSELQANQQKEYPL
ncbi:MULTISPECIES: hypothetical protein [Vibrio]|uniref:hypothetical protein n=2 Tax=Vibrionaceae TaxID=641 RepID=UPI001CDB55CC|nr:hypothetical protein [Vibrio alginolyticus]MDW2096667.1 hypothetical protein [Vibrio sp. 1751]MDW2240820.1 hypothetical protein [Vibrio sp. 1287]MDW2267877.1 hypothetical protein [Vibrio sp. 1394]MCA2454541.1 hypothetical protein [Vibrio alginolyticus]MCA2461496.1 hypothetical protein [Vibrio alginolyticus]